jgi:hypothetical protein
LKLVPGITAPPEQQLTVAAKTIRLDRSAEPLRIGAISS